MGKTTEAYEEGDHAQATADIGIPSRQGCGKLRHFEAKWLWVQDEIAAHRLEVRKVPTPRMRTLVVLRNYKLVEAHATVNKFQVGSLYKDWWYWSP